MGGSRRTACATCVLAHRRSAFSGVVVKRVSPSSYALLRAGWTTVQGVRAAWRSSRVGPA
eukprot:14552468-Alexandrium_andersonii.AAC.1